MDTEKDPILSPREMCEDAGISKATWIRHYRHKLDIIRLSPRRIGVRQSAWRKVLQASAEPRAA
jgi:hypothetical protein